METACPPQALPGRTAYFGWPAQLTAHLKKWCLLRDRPPMWHSAVPIHSDKLRIYAPTSRASTSGDHLAGRPSHDPHWTKLFPEVFVRTPEEPGCEAKGALITEEKSVVQVALDANEKTAELPPTKKTARKRSASVRAKSVAGREGCEGACVATENRGRWRRRIQVSRNVFVMTPEEPECETEDRPSQRKPFEVRSRFGHLRNTKIVSTIPVFQVPNLRKYGS
ncbi:hypothetical protein NDU88_006359 [Pleurodeles waltl]|uniref:Uncharacterized protein n=1 Tax=Pleurodeles waltl TaxID=8319 RepID=A0AAV7WAH9_PLEWA|nr:hypothetical protein NDU88_006359 [Pleurodeles waltl]